MSDAPAPDNLTTRMLATVERVGNKLPDPAMLFVGLLVIVWALSWLFSMVTFEVVDPRSGEPLVVNNLLTGPAMAESSCWAESAPSGRRSRSKAANSGRSWPWWKINVVSRPPSVKKGSGDNWGRRSRYLLMTGLLS